MSTVPNPAGIFDRAVDEGQRRLEQSLLELAATSFIAGVTIVFGIVALGVVDRLVEPQFGTAAHVADALTFGVGMVFLVVGRAELCNENVFDPVAAAVARDGTWLPVPPGRLWAVTLGCNLLGGFLFAVVFAVEGVLPPESTHALSRTAEGIVNRPPKGIFASAIVGGAFVSLLSVSRSRPRAPSSAVSGWSRSRTSLRCGARRGTTADRRDGPRSSDRRTSDGD